MNLRPLDQIPEHVLAPLVVICLRPEQVADLLEKEDRDEPLARMVCELFWALRGSFSLVIGEVVAHKRVPPQLDLVVPGF